MARISRVNSPVDVMGMCMRILPYKVIYCAALLDAILMQDTASNKFLSALLAEALSEVAYLFQCPSRVGAGNTLSESSSQSCHCVAFAASEPSKTPVPWPHPEDCHSAPGLAGYTELCLVSFGIHEPPLV